MRGTRLILSDRVVDLESGEVEGHGRLRPTERGLLAYLAERLDTWVSLDELHARVWGFSAAVQSRAAYTSVARLRSLLEADPREPRHIQGERRAGYRLVRAAVERSVAPLRGTSTSNSAERLVGRVTELGQLAVAAPLWTVVGPGGVGKTVLAAEAVRAGRPPGGTWWCDLHLATDGLSIDQEISRVLPPGPGTLAERVRALGPTVLVLDSLDLVLQDAAAIVAAILAAAPECRVVATSREPLGLRQERILRLGPLSAPEGVALLRERVAQLGGAQLTDVVARQLVEQVDGLPLALEIVAANVARLGATTVLSRLLAGEDLQARRPDAPRRHWSLEQVLDWSWRRLSPEEQHTLAILAVLDGPFQLSTAEVAVGSGSVAERVGKLVDASLIVAEGTRRLRLLTVVRRAVRRRMPVAAAEVLDRLLKPVLDLARAGGDPSPWRQRRVWVSTSVPGLMQVARRLEERTDLDDDLRALIGALLVKEGSSKGASVEVLSAWVELALRRGPSDPVRALLLTQRGRMYKLHGNTVEAIAELGHAASVARECGAWVQALDADYYRASILATVGRTEEALELVVGIEASVDRLAKEDQVLALGIAAHLRAVVSVLRNEGVEDQHLIRCAGYFRAGGRTDVAEDTEIDLARVRIQRGRIDDAEAMLNQPGSWVFTPRRSELKAEVAYQRGEFSKVSELLRHALQHTVHTFHGLFGHHQVMGTLALRTGDPLLATELMNRALLLPRAEPYGQVGAEWAHALLRWIEGDRASASVHLAEARRHAETRGLSAWVQDVASLQAELAWSLGEVLPSRVGLERAVEVLEGALDRSRPLEFAPAALLLAESMLRLGRVVEVLPLVHEVLQMPTAPVYPARAHALLATVAALDGRAELVEGHLAHAVGVNGPGAGWVVLHQAWVEAALHRRPPVRPVLTALPLELALQVAVSEFGETPPPWFHA